ncbi:MAG: hypothetical protein P9M03_02040 [Candidatus Theseobacter exili]|nr:hypothetical protein [Candidatus Theseobacter exili]
MSKHFDNNCYLKPPLISIRNANSAYLITDPYLFNIIVQKHLLTTKLKSIFGVINLYRHPQFPEQTIFAGPAPGSALTAIAIETLIYSGINEIIQIGTCGDLTGNRNLGDILIPSKSISVDGIALTYSKNTNLFYPSKEHLDCFESKINAESSIVASTDAIFLETFIRLQEIIELGADSIEMESAASFCVSSLREVNCSSIHLVSDRLEKNKIISGFSRKNFRTKCFSFLETITQSPFLLQ